MGLSPDSFDDMTPAEFYCAWMGWAKLRMDDERGAWERMRWSTVLLMFIQVEEKYRDAVLEMASLPWDVKESIKQTAISMEERKIRAENILKTIK